MEKYSFRSIARQGSVGKGGLGRLGNNHTEQFRDCVNQYTGSSVNCSGLESENMYDLDQYNHLLSNKLTACLQPTEIWHPYFIHTKMHLYMLSVITWNIICLLLLSETSFYYSPGLFALSLFLEHTTLVLPLTILIFLTSA